jgi:signal transduction histidine kinase
MNFYAISALINALTSLFLGSLVFIKNKKNTTNSAFVLLSLAVFTWSLFYVFWQTATDYKTALLYTRLLSIGSSFIPIFYLHWVLSFLEIKNKKSFLILFFGYILTLFFLTFSFSSFFIKDVEKTMFFQFWPKAGPLYTAYILSYVFWVGYGLKKLYENYITSAGIKRHQIRFVIIGTIIGFLGGATNFFLWYDIPILPFGNIVVSLYVFMLFYAMVKYRLMDIRIVARKIFVYFGISIFAYVFFYFLIWLYNYFFGGLFTTKAYLVGIIVAPLFVFCFYKMESAVKNFANKYLFVSLYNYQETINQLINELNNYIDLDKLINLIIKTIEKAISIEFVSVYLAYTEEQKIKYKKFKIKNLNNKSNEEKFVLMDNFLFKYLSKNQKPLIIEELFYFSQEETITKKEKNNLIKLYNQLENIHASLCLPLITNKRLIGIIILGPKISGEPYTDQDVNLLNLLSKQASIAIENAQQYEEIEKFGETLQEKIDKQTKDIIAQKEIVENISRLKSEFISIASHQLRTPMSAIRGYTSMLEDGDCGDLPTPAKTAIRYIHESSVGMIKLINSLLSISRLEKGQIELNLENISIEEIIKDCIKDFEFLAKEKGLTIIYNKPKINLPTIKGDAEKLKQSFSNIINNAVLYTLEGKIEVSLNKENNDIIIQIKDTGVGIDPEEQEKMFKSFSRGKGGTELYTQGTGLGLYVAKNFVEMHNGSISVFSEGKNKGSLFTIKLPIQSILDSRHKFNFTEK